MNIMNFIVRPSNFLLLKMFQKFAIEGQRYFFTAFLISGSESIAKRKKQTRKNSSRLRTARLCGFGGGVSGRGYIPYLPDTPPLGKNMGPVIPYSPPNHWKEYRTRDNLPPKEHRTRDKERTWHQRYPTTPPPPHLLVDRMTLACEKHLPSRNFIGAQ